MYPKLLRLRFLPLIAFSLVFLGLSSCVSYDEVVGYEDDGIYGRTGRSDQQVRVKNQEAVSNDDIQNNLYGDYFGQKALQYDDILSSEIFTDPESYSSNSIQDSTQYARDTTYFANELYQGYGSWGDNQNQVVINVYDNWGWGGGWVDPWWNWGWGWNAWGPNWGWGWNGWGWGVGSRPGWNNWGWGAGWAWGWGGAWGPGYGWNNWGWNSPFYFNSRGNYWARNGGRRGYSNTAIAANSLRGRSNLTTSSAVRGRSNTSTRSSRMSAYARNQQYRSNRSTRATGRTYGTTRSGRTNTYGRSSSSRSSSNAFRRNGSNTGSRSSGYRSSSSSRSRSSSGYRSGSSRSRSSGTRTSSGSRSRSSASGRSSSSSRSSGGRSSGRSSSGRRN